jgi:phage/plasmid-associated DNA primase
MRLTNHNFALELEKSFIVNDKAQLMFLGQEKQTQAYLYNGVYWKALSMNHAELKKTHFPAMYNMYMAEFDKVADSFKPQVAARIRKDLLQLDSARYRNDVVAALETERHHDSIEWDSHVHGHLFAFEDCIWDLNQACFVEPNPDHYITTTCGFAYGDQTLEHKAEQDLFQDKILTSMFDNPRLQAYILRMMSSLLRAGNVDERGYFWLGRGRNGKGTLSGLLENCQGAYYGELRLGYWTNADKSEDSPNNNLFSVQKCRCVNTSEVGEDIKDPSKPQQFLTNKFKQGTGGDSIACRRPHGAVQVDIRLGTPIIQTNIMPALVGIEDPKNVSLRERVVVVPFPFCFTADPAEVERNPTTHRLRDNGVKALLATPAMRLGVLRLLFASYTEYREQGLNPPPEVVDETAKYFDESNKVAMWFRANMVADGPDAKPTKLRVSDIHDKITTSTSMSKKALGTALERLCGKRPSRDEPGVYIGSGFQYLQGYHFITADGDAEQAPIDLV